MHVCTYPPVDRLHRAQTRFTGNQRESCLKWRPGGESLCVERQTFSALSTNRLVNNQRLQGHLRYVHESDPVMGHLRGMGWESGDHTKILCFMRFRGDNASLIYFILFYFIYIFIFIFTCYSSLSAEMSINCLLLRKARSIL